MTLNFTSQATGTLIDIEAAIFDFGSTTGANSFAFQITGPTFAGFTVYGTTDGTSWNHATNADLVSIAVTTGAQFVAGDTYTIQATSPNALAWDNANNPSEFAFSATVNPVPEPQTYLIFGIGAFWTFRSRKRRLG